jgi:hypothetical protein
MVLPNQKHGFKDLIKKVYQKLKVEPSLCLVLGASLMLLGRGWKYFFFETSFREIFWSQKAFGWFIEDWLGIDWNSYLSTPFYDDRIVMFEKGLGLLLMSVAVMILFFSRGKAVKGVLILVTLFQLPQAYFQFNGVGYNWALMLEFSAQFFMPILLLLYLMDRKELAIKLGVVVIAITFVCHGLYAAGVYNVPQKFLTMSIKTIGLNKSSSMLFLTIMGVLDFVATVMVFIKNFVARRIGLWYMVFWGFVTAVARPWAHFYAFDAARSLFQHFPDFLVRAPHFLLPIFLLVAFNKHARTAP